MSDNPTATEIAVVMEIVNAGSATAAAEELGISYQTIKNHVTHIMGKLGAQSLTHAVVMMWPIIGDHLLLNGLTPDQHTKYILGVQRDRRTGWQRRRG